MLTNTVQRVGATKPHPMREILLYVDGSCAAHRGGHMGAGIVAVSPLTMHRKEYAVYLGPDGSNNEAEIRAVIEGLSRIKTDRITTTVHIYSDSELTIKGLAGECRVRANREYFEQARVLIEEFNGVTFHKVKGHVGHGGNKTADTLAKQGAGNYPRAFAVVLERKKIGLGMVCEVRGVVEPHEPTPLPKWGGEVLRDEVQGVGRG